MACKKDGCKNCSKCVKRKKKESEKEDSRNIKPNFVWKKA